MRCSLAAVALVALVACVAAPASAWSTKEHMQLTRIAALRLMGDPKTPPAMKEWLREHSGATNMAREKEFFLRARVGIVPRDTDGLPYWAVMPDMATYTDAPGKTVEPYGVHERLLHYVDLEYFAPAAATSGAAADRELLAAREKAKPRPVYRHDLSRKPKLEDVPRDPKDPRYKDAGMLPFRVEECYRRFVEQIRDGRLADKPGQFPRDEHAVKWGGYLAHYVADNTQPHHATVDYKSASYVGSDRSAPNVHSEMEYRLPDDDNDDFPALREEFWPLFEAALGRADDPAVSRDDPWKATVEVAMHSYDALPLIGEAAKTAAVAGGKFDTAMFFRFKGRYGDQEMTVAEMKARQLAWAVRRIEHVWRGAWEESDRPQP